MRLEARDPAFHAPFPSIAVIMVQTTAALRLMAPFACNGTAGCSYKTSKQDCELRRHIFPLLPTKALEVFLGFWMNQMF
jgi:hypothetical protein